MTLETCPSACDVPGEVPSGTAAGAARLPGGSGEDLRCAGAGDDSYRGCLEVDMGVTARGVRGVARVLTGSTYALLLSLIHI